MGTESGPLEFPALPTLGAGLSQFVTCEAVIPVIADAGLPKDVEGGELDLNVEDAEAVDIF